MYDWHFLDKINSIWEINSIFPFSKLEVDQVFRDL